MPDAPLLLAALLCAVLGMGWLALAMDVHWNQVREARAWPGGTARARPRGTIMTLRILGAVALFASLLLCLLADTATMAALVWMMLLAVAAALIALVLSWRPRVLGPLAAWTGASRRAE